MIREADEKDLKGLLELYLHLHETSVPETDEKLKSMWLGPMTGVDENGQAINPRPWFI